MELKEYAYHIHQNMKLKFTGHYVMNSHGVGPEQVSDCTEDAGLDLGPDTGCYWYRGHPSHPPRSGRQEETHGPHQDLVKKSTANKLIYKMVLYRISIVL